MNEVQGQLVSTSKIAKRFGSKVVFRDISLTINKGQHTLVSGPSGSGKTTLLRALALLEPIEKGIIRYRNIDVSRFIFHPTAAQEISSTRIGYVSQERDLWPHLTVTKNIALALQLKKIQQPEIDDKIFLVLSKLDLLEEAEKFPAELSGGQRQRCAIARWLVHQPDLLLLDEVTANLDFQNIERVIFAIEATVELGATVVMVSHRTDLPTNIFRTRLSLADCTLT